MACDFCDDRGFLGSPKEKRFCLECERGRFLLSVEPQPKGDAMGSIIRNLTVGYEMKRVAQGAA
jgi:hypothetical protein